ncbi:unnamed protein product [Prorocentrum cordatum]|uniref:Centrosomal protein of 162 kDa n=1 Tax=Prorocentrum cordatum TaxID=2364126 RepID=A0ABN9UBN9_9DINO|nr:unnamed protein product [Polarella glacialis]
MEANRIAEARAADLMRALRSEEMKHKREKDQEGENTLVQRLQGSGRGSAGDEGSEISKLKESLRNMQQEKNVLVNEFEWKELQWKTQIENAQLEVDDLKRRLASEASKHQLRIEALEASAKEALEEARAPPPSPPPAPAEPALALGWLRCPVRSAGPPRVEQPAFCQERPAGRWSPRSRASSRSGAPSASTLSSRPPGRRTASGAPRCLRGSRCSPWPTGLPAHRGSRRRSSPTSA